MHTVRCESRHLKQKLLENPRNPLQLLFFLQNVPPSLRTSNERQFSMAAFLPHPVLIFDSGKTVRQSRWRLFFFVAAADHRQRQTVHRSRRRLSSASLGALRPSSAGFMSVQTSSASATHARTFFCLQRQARGLQRVRSEQAAFLRRFEISA